MAEGSGDNFFIIKNDVIISPEGRNILRGVSRDYVMHTLAKELGLSCIEKNIDPYDVYTADEAFMTGTPFCMLPVTSLNSVMIGDGTPGETFNLLLSKWSKNVGVDIRSQIVNWNNSDTVQSGISPYKFSKK